jgi:uncharacterized SAM-binding protein YcdF (DUF218 family)
VTSDLRPLTSDVRPPASGPVVQRSRKLACSLLALCALLFALYLFRAPILHGAAEVWIVNDHLEKADAIVVLGGGLETRPFEAARLYHEGFAPKILLLKSRLSNTDEISMTKPETELAREVLLTKDVPPEAIEVIGKAVTSTRDEADAVQQWSKQNRPKRIIIPTDLFHTRRVRWLFRKTLGDNKTLVMVRAVSPNDYGSSNWWQHEEGLIAFQNEVVKYALYRWKY